MAEFCLEFWNKINETHDSKWRYVLSWHKDLCEEYGQLKRVIVVERFWSRARADIVQSNRKCTKPISDIEFIYVFPH